MKENYKSNNFIKEGVNHSVLNKIKEKGGAVFIDQSGKLNYRLSPSEDFISTKDYKAVSQVMTNILGEKVVFLPTTKQNLDDVKSVDAEELLMIVGTKFDPHTKEEFIECDNGLYQLNLFRPSPYMQLECGDGDRLNIQTSAIANLIYHLSNYKQEMFWWIINWLAFFVQGLKKSQVALVLRGDVGAGKGIFFNEIIIPFIGKKYTKTINDKSLSSKYLGGLVEDVLFFNLDEISVQKAQNGSIKNFLKALVTNLTVTAEKKFKTLKEEIEIYGQVLITSNEPEVIEVEQGDRRYCINNTGGHLKYVNFLGYGNYNALSSVIANELALFICYLKNYSVDVEKANTPLMTPEKEELINFYLQKQQIKQNKHEASLLPKQTKLEKSIQEFNYAIRTKYTPYFEVIRFGLPELHADVVSDLYNNVFRISNLLPLFKAIYGNGLVKTQGELLRELQKCDMQQYQMSQITFVMIDDKKVECFRIVPIYHMY
jgi:hypothetical protein